MVSKWWFQNGIKMVYRWFQNGISSREFVNGCVNSDADIRDGEPKDTEFETVSEVNDDRETSGTTPSNSIDSAAEASQYSLARYGIANNYHIL